ncbi:MAG: amino acid ABC transporter permease [Pseudomonadota bacterium]
MSDINANSVAFVRHDSLPQQPPPASETGVVKWMRENLFDGWFNTLMTVLALYFIVRFSIFILPWFYNGVWVADSLRECREILDGRVGGCFAVITERWQQLIFGFYPSEGYWRPVLAFIGMLVALAPILFNTLPRAMLIFTALFPFIGYFLIWGGSIWAPIMALAGFVIGYYVNLFVGRYSLVFGLLAGVLAAIIWWMFLAGEFAEGFAYLLPIGLEVVESRNVGGFVLTYILGISSLVLSLPLGILLALGRQSNLFIIKTVCVIFIEFIRGVPLITLLFVANVILAYFLPPGTTFDLILRVIIMITLFSSAYIAEVIRGGLAALPRGQYEAADSLGLDYPQAIRLIILPQALKISIPGIVNVFIGLFKDTTLVSVISMFDPIGLIRGPILADANWNGVYWELFGFAALVFFVFCYAMSQYSQYLERKLNTGHR